MSSYEPKNNSDGTPNPKYVDLLYVDPPVAEQNFVCMSFVSPDKVLKQKNSFLFERFVRNFDLDKSSKKFVQFLNFISYKYNLNFNKVMDDFNDFLKSEQPKLVETTIEDDYKNFLDANEKTLEQEFNQLVNFQTSTHGVKVRGVFPSQEEAGMRCKMLREIDPNHDIYVGPVGVWVPWEPEAYRTGKVDYMEDELNQLMHKKMENETEAKKHFDQRVIESKKKAIEENIRKAKETGNKLTQNIDENGNLVGINNTIDASVGEGASSSDIRNELFDGDNVVTGSGKNKKINKRNGSK
uniref:Uncharacterized protein n=1 Tax=viral metagenome TaxID=1070528 RepID=A0A6C0BTZ2_9ZZZZ